MDELNTPIFTEEDRSFVIDENGNCYLNGQELRNVLNVSINNINATKLTEVTLTVVVDSVDVKYKRYC